MADRPPVLVDSSPLLKDAARRLAGADRYYLDTEFDLSASSRRLCLIQVSRGEQVFLVDTMRLTALEPLAEAISRPEAEWVLHSGGQDVAWLRDALKLDRLPRLFDTQVAWGLIGPEYPVSLAYLFYRILGIRSAKEQQAADWKVRPLTNDQIAYAADDVEHLPAIREWLAERLAKLDRLARVHDVSTEMTASDPPAPLALDDFRNAWQLDAAGQAALLFLIDWHNHLTPAEKRYAPYSKTLLLIAKMLPETGAELSRVRGVPFDWARREGDAFCGKLLRASAGASGKDFVPLEPPPYNTFERIRAEGWIRGATAEITAELGLAPELSFPGRVLMRMTDAVLEKGNREAAADALEGWRADLLGAPLRARAAAARPPAGAPEAGSP